MLDKRLLDCISKSRILKHADAKNLNACFTPDVVSVESFCQNDLIYSPRSTCLHVGIILSGTAIASPVSSSDGVMLRLMCVGDVFGIANLYAESECFPSVITAKNDVEVLFIESNAFCALLECDKNAMKAYLSFLCDRIIYLNKKISTLTAGNTERKLAFFLCENESGGEFVSPLSMCALAETLSIGRASLYRALDALVADGLIVRDGKKILIPDKNALLNFI